MVDIITLSRLRETYEAQLQTYVQTRPGQFVALYPEPGEGVGSIFAGSEQELGDVVKHLVTINHVGGHLLTKKIPTHLYVHPLSPEANKIVPWRPGMHITPFPGREVSGDVFAEYRSTCPIDPAGKTPLSTLHIYGNGEGQHVGCADECGFTMDMKLSAEQEQDFKANTTTHTYVRN